MFYFLVGWSLPYAVALKRGGTVVSASDWFGDSIRRNACINGGNVVFPDRVSEKGLEIGIIDQHNERHSMILEFHDRYSRCLNRYGEKVTVAAWDEWIDEENERAVTVMTYHDGMVEKSIVELPAGPYTLYITDIENGSVLGHIKQVVGPDSVDGGLFIISTKGGDPIIPPVGTGEQIESGVFWSDGFVYKDRDRIIFRGNDGRQEVLGEIHDGDITTKTRDSVVWTTYKAGTNFVRGFTRDAGQWEKKGAYPFLSNGKLIVVDKEAGGVVVMSLNDGERTLLVKAEKARNPVYLNHKVYWEEEVLNISFPIQFIHYMFGGESPQFTQSHLFEKVVDL